MKLTFLLALAGHLCLAQTDCTILILTNRKASVLLDGERKGEALPNTPYKVVTTPGDHYAQVQVGSEGEVMDKGEIITAEEGKQKILKLLFDESASTPTELLNVADLNVAIPGVVTVTAWQQNNSGQSYPYPSYYFAFEEGDVMVVNTSMTNKNGTNMIEIATYPDGVVKYSNTKFTELNNLEIRVDRRSIFKITLGSNHAFDRNGLLRISRKPSSPTTSDFDTNVVLRKIYTPVQVIEPQTIRVNSGSNAAFLGGKSRVIIPVRLPPNTVEWFYRFSASRNPEDIESVQENFALFGELSKLLLTASGFGVMAAKAVDIGVEQLATPPGANYADVYLLQYEQVPNFQSKVQYSYLLEGTRENLMSGNVRVTCCNQGEVYLGIKNPDTYNAVNVSLEVVGITMKEEYVMVNDK